MAVTKVGTCNVSSVNGSGGNITVSVSGGAEEGDVAFIAVASDDSSGTVDGAPIITTNPAVTQYFFGFAIATLTAGQTTIPYVTSATKDFIALGAVFRGFVSSGGGWGNSAYQLQTDTGASPHSYPLAFQAASITQAIHLHAILVEVDSAASALDAIFDATTTVYAGNFESMSAPLGATTRLEVGYVVYDSPTDGDIPAYTHTSSWSGGVTAQSFAFVGAMNGTIESDAAPNSPSYVPRGRKVFMQALPYMVTSEQFKRGRRRR